MIGDDKTIEQMPSVPALPPFAEPVISFFNDLSKLVMQRGRQYSDVMTFGFWCRKGALLKEKDISPEEMNNNIRTVIIAPMTTKTHAYPTRIPVRFNKKSGWIVLDQIRTVDKARLVKKLGRISSREVAAVKDIIKQMLVD